MIRCVVLVVIALLTYTGAASAQVVYVECPPPGSTHAPKYLTIDYGKGLVRESYAPIQGKWFAAKITDAQVSWREQGPNGVVEYDLNRYSGQMDMLVIQNGALTNNLGYHCHRYKPEQRF